MPAISSEGGGGGASQRSSEGDDLSTMDEVKVFKDEGEDENEQNASESLQAELLEEKSSLITESEQVKWKWPTIYLSWARHGTNQNYKKYNFI